MSNARPGPLGDVVERLQGEVTDLRRSRRRLAEAAHDDRRAIERALHDGVQQYLVALAIDLRRLSGLLDGDRAAAEALLDELRATTREALDEAADLARRIYPPLLGSGGLATALRSAAEEVGIAPVVDIPRSAAYPPECEAALYWACAAAFAAAAPGSTASVRVRDGDGALSFEIVVAGHLTDDRVDRLRDLIEALDGRVTLERLTDGRSRVQGRLSLSR